MHKSEKKTPNYIIFISRLYRVERPRMEEKCLSSHAVLSMDLLSLERICSLLLFFIDIVLLCRNQ